MSVARFHSAGDSGRSLQSGSVIHGSAGSSSGSGNSSLGQVNSGSGSSLRSGSSARFHSAGASGRSLKSGSSARSLSSGISSAAQVSSLSGSCCLYSLVASLGTLSLFSIRWSSFYYLVILSLGSSSAVVSYSGYDLEDAVVFSIL